MEYLIAEKGNEDFSKETVQSPCDQMLFMVMAGDDANGNSEEQREKPVEETNKENPPSNSTKRTHDDGSAQREDKKIPRNKACPCGSKKKYKSCCESGTGKVSAISNDQALESR
ncbi:OVARIAN TUMOR DOMAIN-containing deubiquitinating enzyme 7 isoform X2 [Eucalyptus grandis]|uniref:OVARIAN TUMOR DOMAIN-containing deubiquitinating enzyme 7 isoform X2 n=1 Tax=Eucalyptus grandis TaxID=71139 RepID=UPI00192E8606|nr:OVARIAN TUMOR DOMAIN-containing deubiquitinating enzyme 7 isoform X2 [Eucalyptus grandis]